MMKATFTMAALSLLLCGCGRSDGPLKKEVVGNWSRDSHFKMTLSPDGSFVSRWIAPDKNLTYEGTWKIQDRRIKTTITNCVAEGYSITNTEPVGSVDHFAIIRADATRLVYSNNNSVISFKRE